MDLNQGGGVEKDNIPATWNVLSIWALSNGVAQKIQQTSSLDTSWHKNNIEWLFANPFLFWDTLKDMDFNGMLELFIDILDLFENSDFLSKMETTTLSPVVALIFFRDNWINALIEKADSYDKIQEVYKLIMNLERFWFEAIFRTSHSYDVFLKNVTDLLLDAAEQEKREIDAMNLLIENAEPKKALYLLSFYLLNRTEKDKDSTSWNEKKYKIPSDDLVTLSWLTEKAFLMIDEKNLNSLEKIWIFLKPIKLLYEHIVWLLPRWFEGSEILLSHICRREELLIVLEHQISLYLMLIKYETFLRSQRDLEFIVNIPLDNSTKVRDFIINLLQQYKDKLQNSDVINMLPVSFNTRNLGNNFSKREVPVPLYHELNK